MKIVITGGAMAAAVLLSAGVAAAATGQDAPAGGAPVQEEVLGGPQMSSSWGIFSRGATRHYLIDIRSVTHSGGEATITIARVPTDTPAGDYSHTLDRFAVQCQGNRSRVVSSTDVSADGVADEPYPADEPWEAISPRSFDSAIQEIACDSAEPQPPFYPSDKAYFDAGRP